MVDEALARAAPLVREREVGAVDAVPAGLALVGDRLTLEQVVSNLLTDPLEHTGAGSTVWGRARPGTEGWGCESGVIVRPVDPEHPFHLAAPNFALDVRGRRA